jgi:hypothetical protein
MSDAPRPHGHEPIGQLALYLSGELDLASSARIARCLAECPDCRARLLALEAGSNRFAHHARTALNDVKLPGPSVGALLRKLDPVIATPPAAATRVDSAQSAPRPVWIAAFCGVLAVPLLVVLIATTGHAPLSASELLSRAERAAASPGGAPQKRVRVRLTSRNQQQEWMSVANGPGHPAKLHGRFQTAGIDWTDPLSPRSYRVWRSSLQAATDRIQEDRETIALQTVPVKPSPIEWARLTVNAIDFRPTSRSVQFADSDRIDITEWTEPTPSVAAYHRTETRPAPPNEVRDSARPSTVSLRGIDLLLRLETLSWDWLRIVTIASAGSDFRVEGIVDTSMQANELEALLAGAANVHVNVENREALSRTVRMTEAAPILAPPIVAPSAELKLKELLHTNRAVDEFEEHAQRSSSGLLSAAVRLSQLAVLVPEADLATAPAPSRDRVLTRLRRESQGFLDACSAQKQSVEVVLPLFGVHPRWDTPQITKPHFAEAAGRVAELAARLNRLFAALFGSVRGSASDDTPISAMIQDLYETENSILEIAPNCRSPQP